jgi:hypothetical protein
MDLRIATDVFRRRPSRRIEVDRDLLGADAYVCVEPAFVTGLRDWRRMPAIASRQSSDAADGDWHPL